MEEKEEKDEKAKGKGGGCFEKGGKGEKKLRETLKEKERKIN